MLKTSGESIERNIHMNALTCCRCDCLKTRAVLFDLGDTLVKTWIPEVTYQKVLASLGINKSVEEIKEALSKTEHEFKESNYRSMYGKASYIEYWKKWDSLVLKNLNIFDECFAEETLKRWWDYADCVTYPDTRETLARLKQMGLKLGLVSTAYEEDITAIFEKANLKKGFFDIIIGANTIKREKPHPDVFKYALKKLKVKPEETLFVGDHIDNDYKGARAVGIDALLIQRENRSLDNTSDFKRISSLEEIYKFMV
jgi:2-haloalkanoic acid dehalogenase type II